MAESKFKCEFNVCGKVLEVGETQTFGSGFQKRSVIIEASKKADEFSNPVEVTLKKESCSQGDAIHAGDFVEVTGYVEGRKWTKPTGEVRHFIDLSVKSLVVTDRAPLPTTAKDWSELLKLGAAYGETKEGVTERARAYGKPFKGMTEADWQKLAAEIVAAHAPKDEPPAGEEGDPEDLPF